MSNSGCQMGISPSAALPDACSDNALAIYEQQQVQRWTAGPCKDGSLGSNMGII